MKTHPYWVMDTKEAIPRVACLCVDLPMAKRFQALWPDTVIVKVQELRQDDNPSP